jgi:hypothetical protein
VSPDRTAVLFNPAVFVVANTVSAIALKEVAKILCLGVRGSTQGRFDAEDFLQRFQRGTVVVVDGIAKTFLPPPFANGERMNMPIGPSLNFPLSFGLIPNDEERAAFLVLVGLGN